MGNESAVKAAPETGRPSMLEKTAVPTPASPAYRKLPRLIGNQAMQRLIQAKLAVSQPADPDERLADNIARHVVRQPRAGASPGSRRCACGGTVVGPGGECARCRLKRIQRQGVGNQIPGPISPRVTGVLKAPGRPLEATTRQFMEPRFGHDFSQVRVHTDPQAQAAARDINAKAYTVGQNIVFGQGHYAPHTTAGQELLAHELVHTIQQGSTAAKIQREESEVETEDDQVTRVRQMEDDELRQTLKQWSKINVRVMPVEEANATLKYLALLVEEANRRNLDNRVFKGHVAVFDNDHLGAEIERWQKADMRQMPEAEAAQARLYLDTLKAEADERNLDNVRFERIARDLNADELLLEIERIEAAVMTTPVGETNELTQYLQTLRAERKTRPAPFTKEAVDAYLIDVKVYLSPGGGGEYQPVGEVLSWITKQVVPFLKEELGAAGYDQMVAEVFEYVLQYLEHKLDDPSSPLQYYLSKQEKLEELLIELTADMPTSHMRRVFTSRLIQLHLKAQKRERQLNDPLRIMPLQPRGPYGGFGGVVLPVMLEAGAQMTKDAIGGIWEVVAMILEPLTNVLASLSAFFQGLMSGLEKKLTAADLEELSYDLMVNQLLMTLFPPPFMAGVVVGTVEYVTKEIIETYEMIKNIEQVVEEMLKFLELLFSEDGAAVMYQIGEQLGLEAAKKIKRLISLGIFEFAYESGKLAAPIIFEVLIGYLTAGGSAGRKVVKEGVDMLTDVAGKAIRKRRKKKDVGDVDVDVDVDDVDVPTKQADVDVSPKKKKVSLTTDEEKLLRQTKGKEDLSEMTLPEIRGELAIVERSPKTAVIEADFINEVDLPNTHTWKEGRSQQKWCRFSKPKGPNNCVNTSSGMATAVRVLDKADFDRHKKLLFQDLPATGGDLGQILKLLDQELLQDHIAVAQKMGIKIGPSERVNQIGFSSTQGQRGYNSPNLKGEWEMGLDEDIYHLDFDEARKLVGVSDKASYEDVLQVILAHEYKELLGARGDREKLRQSIARHVPAGQTVEAHDISLIAALSDDLNLSAEARQALRNKALTDIQKRWKKTDVEAERILEELLTGMK